MYHNKQYNQSMVVVCCLENSILNFCGRIWGSGVWIICRVIKGLLAPLLTTVLGPPNAIPSVGILGIPSFKEICGNWDNELNTQYNLWNILIICPAEVWGLTKVWSEQNMEFACSEFVVGVHIQLRHIQYIFSEWQLGSAGLFWERGACSSSLEKCNGRLSDRILVSAQQPKEEKCHKLWTAPYSMYTIYTHLTYKLWASWLVYIHLTHELRAKALYI